MLSKILFQGDFSESDVICKYVKESSRKIDPEIEEKTKQLWVQKVKKAREMGKKVWDQPVYRLEKFEVDDNVCTVEFSTIPFSIRLPIMQFVSDLVKKGEQYLPMATYSSIFIETSDGNFVFGEKSDKYLTNRKYSYIGGVFNKTEEDNDAEVDLFGDSIKEVTEELGIDEENDIEDFKLFGAFRSETCNVGFIFYCKLKLSDDEVLKKFKKKNDLELKRLLVVRKGDIRDFGVNRIGKESQMIDIFEQATL